ncbi:MAG: hypothetical protein IKK82_12715 [Kiritimatiellae bacterium]|nr:hypothetical protein [Kiritimatiellia bacterium]
MKRVVMFVLSFCCLLGAVAVDPAAVEFLGEKAEPEIRTGCVVYGGEYLKPPYVVKRMGNEVFINDRSIRWFVPWPIPKPVVRGVTKAMPSIPDGIGENTSEWDKEVRKFKLELLDHLIYLGITNRVERFAAEISKLPNVSSAQVLSDREVAVWWKNGTQGVPCMIYPERHDRRSKKWPQDKKTLQEMGDREVAKFAGALRGDSFLLLPGGDCHIAISGAGLDRDVYRAIGMCDAGLSPEKICEKLGGRTEFPMELSEALVRHRNSFGKSYYTWAKRKIVPEIEAEKRAEREREEKEAAERKRAVEEYARRKAAELEPTVRWTPENARKGGMRFYAYYKSIRYSGEPFVPYAFWPRSTQPGDKWKYKLRENAVQAFDGFFGAHEPTNTKIEEDIAAGCKRVRGKLRPETIQWSISCDFPVAKDNPAAYARIPMLVSANLNPAYLLREWDGSTDAGRIIPLGPESGAEKSLFDDAYAVIIFNDGSAETIPANELTYMRIYRHAFKGPSQFGYLTIRGYVEPKGM